ncbi:MAG: HAMP domain-containing histidine kinase [Ilumatobacteraceae bacterium]|nr:HAMP domain-containing histidine kinase [Ilumatobacteraceae bacterium]
MSERVVVRRSTWSARLRNTSLRLRVTAVATIVVALTLLATGLLVTRWLRSTLVDDADQQLSRQVEFVANLAEQGKLSPTLTATGVDTGQVQVITGDRVVVAVSPGLAATVRLDVFPAPAVGAQAAQTVPGPVVGGVGSTHYRVVARTVDTPVGPLTVYAASSLRAAEKSVAALVAGLWVGLPLLTLLAVAGIWFVVGRSLSPVERMRREVAAIPGTRPDQRISAHARAAELDRLAATMNGLLERIDEAAAARRQFLADASHELRSPLASVRAQLEVGLAYPSGTDWPATATEVMVDIDRLQSLAVELLDLARVDGGGRLPTTQRLDLAALVDVELARYTDQRVTVESSSAWVAADAALLLRLVRNLVDNALRHAHQAVRITVGVEGDAARMRVWNDGAPIPEGDRDRIFEPFTRLDEARTTDEGGAGLGLSIARRVTELHGGTLVVGSSDTGAEFIASLPLALAS